MRHYLAPGLFFLLFYTAAAQSERGMVASYLFNQANGKDDAGSNHAKIVDAALATDRFGNPQSAYYLHGNSNSYINLGTSPVLKPDQATISLWVNLDKIVHKGSGVAYNPFLLTKSRPGNDFYEGYFMGIDCASQRVNVNAAISESVGVGITSSNRLTLNTWHHLVMAYNDQYMWLYIDGVLQNDGRPMPKNFRSQFLKTDSVMIGSMANLKNWRFLSGTVDDIFIYNRVLSHSEIYELYMAPDPNKTHVYLSWLYRVLALIAGVVIIVRLTAKYYKKALEKEKENNRIEKRLAELETKAIRTQMNPHFMFNSLNTLQRFILEEDTRGAQNYLSKFSKLLRKILESGNSDSIPLSEEIEILTTYVELERLRFDRSFNYTISSTVVNPEKCHIPFLLIQPFVENAIWHGLLPLKGSKLLSVTFSGPFNKTIVCLIEDNGVGMEFSALNKNPLGKRSQAIDFIRQRLELLEKSTGVACTFSITDKKNDRTQDSGTRVEISIPTLNPS